MLCWTRYLFIIVVIVLGTGSMLSACGQKGPLVLPDKSEQLDTEAVETNTEQQPE